MLDRSNTARVLGRFDARSIGRMSKGLEEDKAPFAGSGRRARAARANLDVDDNERGTEG